jgi:hypothetical protein
MTTTGASLAGWCVLTLLGSLPIACSDSTPATDAGERAEGGDRADAEVAHGADATTALSDSADAAALLSDVSDPGPEDRSAEGGFDGPDAQRDLEAMVVEYRSWRPLSPTAVDISASIFALCRTPTSSEEQFVASVHSRHALRDWANHAAAAVLDAGDVVSFPEGAAIVKEKFVIDSNSGMPVLTALGIMVKRRAGFDDATGNWEFAYWNATDGLTTDSTRSCGSCHASQSAKDFVFLDQGWRTSRDQ